MVRILWIAVLAGLWTVLDTSPAAAQFSPDRIFGFFDRNDDGVIDADEAEDLRGPMREAFESGGGRPVSREEFARLFEERMRRGEGDRDRERSDRDRSDRESDDRRRSTTRTPGREAPKPRERVTPVLPAGYLEGDLDGDGQIALHEWIQWKSRAAIGEFLLLDRNQDGFLTPHELIVAEKANGNGGASGSGSTATLANRTTTPVSRSTPQTRPAVSGSSNSSNSSGSRGEQAGSDARRGFSGDSSRGRSSGTGGDERGRSGGTGGDERSRGGEDRFRGGGAPGGGPGGRFFPRRQ